MAEALVLRDVRAGYGETLVLEDIAFEHGQRVRTVSRSLRQNITCCSAADHDDNCIGTTLVARPQQIGVA
jgi:hypothetical protein